MSDDLKALREIQELARKLLEQKVSHLQRMPLLRAAGHDAGLSLRDNELWAIVAAARKEMRGDGDGITPDMEIEIPDDDWCWEPLICSGSLNLVIALQKVGKTALILQMIRLWASGADEFLGFKFHGKCPAVIIVGTDMALKDWQKMLSAAGLMERTASGKWRLMPPIVRLFHRGDPAHLDDQGIEKIATICEQHPGSLLLVDSLAAVTAPLGIDEFKPEAAEPLYGLCEAAEPFGTTTVLIHHASKSRAGERASNAARGSNSITAAASQMINLQWHSESKSDQRVDLSTEGRGSKSIQVVIEQIERCSWILHGDAAEIHNQESRRDAEEKLSERQRIALGEVREQWDKHRHEMDAPWLRELLPAEYNQKSAQRSASDTLNQLCHKSLLEKRSTNVPDRGEVNLYRPFGADLTEARLRTLQPSRAGVPEHPPHPPTTPTPPKHEQPYNLPLFSLHSSGDEGVGPVVGAGGNPRAREGDLVQLNGRDGTWRVALIEHTRIGLRLRVESTAGDDALVVSADQLMPAA